jgi:hypothetical protein
MQRAFTQPTDRAIAFAGLEKRLAKAFSTDAHYGITGKFLHRNLLWLRKANTTLTWTRPEPHDSQEITPSWSWMAYEGSIGSMSINFESVAWSEALRFRNSKELECRVREFKDCNMVREGDEFVLLGTGGSDEGSEGSEGSNDARSDGDSVEDGDSYEPPKPRSWLRFDVDAPDLESLKCVAIGREFGYYSNQYEKDCYVIIVKSSGSGGGMFERAGVGSVESRFISLDEPGIRASIV